MSRGLGKVQRQIIAILEKHQDWHNAFILENPFNIFGKPIIDDGVSVKDLAAKVYHPDWFDEKGDMIDYWFLDEIPNHEMSSTYRAIKSLEKRGLVETAVHKGEWVRDPFRAGHYDWSLPYQARRELRVKLVDKCISPKVGELHLG